MNLYNYLASLFGGGGTVPYREWQQEQMQKPQRVVTNTPVMSYDQYKQNYLPMLNMQDAYEKHVAPITEYDWRDNDPVNRYIREVKNKQTFDNIMRGVS